MKKIVFFILFSGLTMQAQEWLLTTPLKEVSQITTMNFNSNNGVLLLDTTYRPDFVGGLYRSDDGGSIWARIPVGIPNDLFMIDNNIGFVLTNGSSIIKTANRFVTTTSSALGFSDMNEVFFIDANIGFCCGTNGTIIKTNNGGETWIAVDTSITDLLEDIYFINSQVGFACSTNGKILKTINQGATWAVVESTATIYMKRFLFLNDQLGFALGDVLKKTTDGGNTWAVISLPGGGNDIVSWNNKLIISSGFGNIYSSSDVGVTWQRITAPNTTGTFYTLAVDLNNRLVLSDKGRLYVTTNGTTWNYFLDGIYRSDLIGISFSDANRGVVIGDGNYSSVLYRTADGGMTWIKELLEFSLYNKFKTVSLNSNGVGMTAGELNTPVWNTTNYGDTWNPGPTNIPAVGNFTSCFMKSNRDFFLGTYNMVNAAGLLSWKTVGGWSQNRTMLSQINQISFSDDNHGVIGGYSGRIFKTVDGGVTWTSIGLPGSELAGGAVTIKHLQMVNENLIYADNYRSIDGGLSWELTHFLDAGIFNQHFFNSQLGYGINSVKIVYKTLDGGLTWLPVNSVPLSISEFEFNAIYFLSDKIVGVYRDSDIYVLQLQNPLSIEEIGTTSTANISFYPNPVSNQLHFDTSITILEAKLYDLQMRNISIDLVNNTIDMSSLPSGVYIVKVKTPSGIVNKKIVKR